MQQNKKFSLKYLVSKLRQLFAYLFLQKNHQQRNRIEFELHFTFIIFPFIIFFSVLPR